MSEWTKQNCDICGAYLKNGKCPYPGNSTHAAHALNKLNDSQAAELTALRAKLAEVTRDLEQIVCTKDPDRGMVMLSIESPTHWDAEAGYHVYKHENFSPLGDALIALHEKIAALHPPATEEVTHDAK